MPNELRNAELITYNVMCSRGPPCDRHVKTQFDNLILQDMINKLLPWTDTWQLNLNVDKCVTVSYGRQVDKSHTNSMH